MARCESYETGPAAWSSKLRWQKQYSKLRRRGSKRNKRAAKRLKVRWTPEIL
jgi:hypothetical protein